MHDVTNSFLHASKAWVAISEFHSLKVLGSENSLSVPIQYFIVCPLSLILFVAVPVILLAQTQHISRLRVLGMAVLSCLGLFLATVLTDTLWVQSCLPNVGGDIWASQYAPGNKISLVIEAEDMEPLNEKAKSIQDAFEQGYVFQHNLFHQKYSTEVTVLGTDYYRHQYVTYLKSDDGSLWSVPSIILGVRLIPLMLDKQKSVETAKQEGNVFNSDAETHFENFMSSK